VRGCASCFDVSSPIDLTIVDPEEADCDFCGAHGATWLTTVWADDFSRVIDIYRLARPGESGAAPMSVSLQRDWSMFSFNADSLIQSFISSVFGGSNPLVEGDDLFVPRFELTGRNADQAAAWTAFVNDITSVNRYFPGSELDLAPLQDVISRHLLVVPTSTIYYRARVSADSARIMASSMGSPPVAKTRPGRANSAGIPALYVAEDPDVAIKESRATQHSYVTLATFTTVQDFECLDLTDVHPENAFEVDDDLRAALSASRFLTRLDFELSRPMRNSDTFLEYVPTQYFCDYVKSTGVVAVRYQSSMSRTGNNLVIFDESVVKVRRRTVLLEVTDMVLTTVSA